MSLGKISQMPLNVDATISNDKMSERVLKRKEFELEAGEEDTVSLFNEIGILYLRKGQNIEAKQAFTKALNQEIKSKTSKSVRYDFLVDVPEKKPDSEASCEILPNQDCQFSKETEKRLQGDYDEGMHIYTSALHTNKSFSPELRVATLLYNIGQVCVRNKQYAEAKRWFKLALTAINDCKHGQYATASVNIVKVQHNLGHCYYRLKQYKEAIRYYEEALVNVGKISLSQLDLAVACNCVAVIYFHQNPSNSSKMIELLQLSITIYRKIVGDYNRELGTFLNNIGRVYFMRLEFDEALKVYREALHIRRQTIGCDSLDLATTLFNTGQSHHECRNFNEAMRHYREFLDIAEQRLGVNNCDVVAAYKCTGRAYSQIGDIKQARSMFEQALKSERATFGEFHPQLGSTLNDLGTLCYEMNDMVAALKHFRDGLSVEKLSKQPNLPHIAITLLNIAHIYKNDGKYTEAFNTYKEAHALQVKYFGNSCLEVASTLSSMGLMQYLLKDYLSSLDYYQEALQVRRDCYGSDEDLDIAASLNSIGLIFYKINNYELARDFFKESMKIRQRLLGLIHKDVAILWYNIAAVSLEMGDEEQAIQSYEESLRQERKTMGDDHPEVAATLRHLGQVHQQRGELDDAIRYYSEALEIQRRVGDDNEVAICKLLNLIGNIHLMGGNVDDMMKCYVEAARIDCQEQGGEWHSLVITGLSFYGLSKLHPACAPVA